MSEHTPGPWTISPACGDFVVPQLDGFPSGVAAVAVALRGAPNRSEEEVGANARLIAAAPELLDALKNLMHAEHAPYRGPLQYDSVREDAWDRARAAVARAAGRES
jgi:hypothetical protein